jgi:hypothetical protein
MLMPNSSAGAGTTTSTVVWTNQQNLSTSNSFISEDPEIAGYGQVLATVWEEINQNGDFDIFMKYSLNDGLTWSFPSMQPPSSPNDEINPAVAVTRVIPSTTASEIHIVYQRYNPSGSGYWEVFHVYTTNYGTSWLGPTRISTAPAPPTVLNAIDPACVYTEDHAPRMAGVLTYAVQMVWAEETSSGSGDYQIMYQAFRFDPMSLVLIKGLHFPTPQLVRTNPSGTGYSCMRPEIASVEDSFWTAQHDFYLAIVWEEEIFTHIGYWPNQWYIWYVDGIFISSGGAGPPPRTIGLNLLTPGQISAAIPPYQSDALEPDISATQDYQGVLFPPPFETYFMHITYEYKTWTGFPSPPARPNSIESSYYFGNSPTPGANPFTPTVSTQSSTTIQLERPTIASKLVSLSPLTFETWLCWEDWSNVNTAPDIWFNLGVYTMGIFSWTGASIMVNYAAINKQGPEHNPELWNKNDISRSFPPLTHLVFDDKNPSSVPEITYIDP